MILPVWVWYGLFVGAWLSVVVLLWLFAFFFFRRQERGAQVWVWLAAIFVAWTWSLGVALSFLLPVPWSWYARHGARLMATWAPWVLLSLLGVLLFPEQRWWKIVVPLGMVTGIGLWFRFPFAYRETVLLGGLRVLTYRPYLPSLIVDIASTLLVLVAALARMRTLFRREFVAGLLGFAGIGLALVLLSLFGIPNAWDWAASFFWVLAGHVFVWLRRFPSIPAVSFESLASRLPEGMAVLDTENRVLWFNQTFQTLWPRPIQVGQSLPASLPSSHPLHQFSEHAQDWIEMVPTQGGPRYLYIRSMPLHQRGRVQGRLLYVRDETPRRQAQEELNRYFVQTRRLNALLESLVLREDEPAPERLRIALRSFLEPSPGFVPQALALYAYDADQDRFELALTLGVPRTWFREHIPGDEGRHGGDETEQALRCLQVEPPREWVYWVVPLQIADRYFGFLWLAGQGDPEIAVRERQALAQSVHILTQTLHMEALTQRRLWLTRALEQTTQALVLTTWPQPRLLFGNSRAHQEKIWDWLQAHLAQAEAEGRLQALMQGLKVEWSAPFVREGSERRLRILGIPVTSPSASGMPEHVLWLLQDVTEYEASIRQLERQTAFLESLLNLGQSILAGGMRLVEVLRRILNAAQAMVGAESGTLILVDERLQPYGTFTGSDLFPPGEFTYRALEQGLAGWVLRHRQSQIVGDTLQDARWLPSGYREWRSVLSVPIYYGNTPLAVLTLTHSQPHRFHEAHQRLLEAAADMMALALYSVRLYEEQYFLTVQTAATLDEMGALWHRRERWLTLLGQALRPLVEDMEERLKALKTHLPDDSAVQEWFARLWDAWLELHRYAWMLQGFRVLRQPNQIRPVRPAHVVEQVYALLEPFFQRNENTLHTQWPSPDWTVMTDEAKLFYILLHLLHNATKFTHKGEIQIQGWEDEDAFFLRIADTGVGMPVEARQRFIQAVEEGSQGVMTRGEAKGMGLFLVADLLRDLRGEITLHSQPHRGTEIVLRFPKSEGA